MKFQFYARFPEVRPFIMKSALLADFCVEDVTAGCLLALHRGLQSWFLFLTELYASWSAIFISLHANPKNLPTLITPISPLYTPHIVAPAVSFCDPKCTRVCIPECPYF